MLNCSCAVMEIYLVYLVQRSKAHHVITQGNILIRDTYT